MNSPPITNKEALEQCLTLWEYLRDNPDVSKRAAVLVSLGYVPLNYCPACARADGDCDLCPIAEWSEQSKHGKGFACENDPQSPYLAWLLAGTTKDEVENAGLMIEMIKKNLENLE